MERACAPERALVSVRCLRQDIGARLEAPAQQHCGAGHDLRPLITRHVAEDAVLQKLSIQDAACDSGFGLRVAATGRGCCRYPTAAEEAPPNGPRVVIVASLYIGPPRRSHPPHHPQDG